MKKALSLFLIICMLFTLVGCSDEPEEYSVTVAIDGIPKSLDPQIATSASELAVIYNTCEGLMRFNPDGTVGYGAAAAHSVSSDSLTYTFTLREGLKWSDGAKLTAADFVYGLKRAVLPETKSLSVESFYAIEGAKEIAEGTADISALGVSCSGNTVTVKLKHADPDILLTLATAAAMPCREDFFIETKGKYGLTAELFICSGPFYVKKWSQETSSVSLRISKNPEYNGNITVRPASVVMFFNNDNDHITEMYEGQLGSSYLPAYLYDSAVQKGLNTSVAQTESYVLCLNNAAPIFSTQKMRHIFAASIDRTVIQSKLSYGSTLSDSIIPAGYRYSCGLYSEISTTGVIGYDASAADGYLEELSVIKSTLEQRLSEEAAAEQAYLDAVKKAQEEGEPIPEKPVSDPTPYDLYSPWSTKDTVETDFSIICLDSPDITQVAQAVGSSWEKAFGITVSVKALAESELTSAAKSGNYFAAILPIKASDCSAKTFLYSFASFSTANAVKYANEQYDSIISGIYASGITTAKLAEAENFLYSSASVIPLFTRSHMMASMSNITDIRFVTPNGYLDFSQALNAD